MLSFILREKIEQQKFNFGCHFSSSSRSLFSIAWPWPLQFYSIYQHVFHIYHIKIIHLTSFWYVANILQKDLYS